MRIGHGPHCKALRTHQTMTNEPGDGVIGHSGNFPKDPPKWEPTETWIFNQPRPTITEAEVATILANAPERYAAFFALLAGTGLRIGEALALTRNDFSADCTVLSVKRSIWHGHSQEPKTPAAIRVVDIPEPLAVILREYIATKTGYLLATRKGNRPLAQRNVLRVLHDTGVRAGFHALRRFRTHVLRRARVPEDLIRLWLGHAPGSVTDLYAWRKEWAERVGLGFAVGPRWATNVVSIETQEAA